MKKVIFFILLLPFAAQAQTELGIGGGISANTAPTGNMPYKSNNPAPNYAGMASVIFNLSTNWQLGLQVRAEGLSGRSSHTYTDPHGNEIGDDGKRFVYAAPLLSGDIVLNRRVGFGKGYFYYGIAAGGAGSVNNHSISNSVSYRAPDGGVGYEAGLQIGYTLGVTSSLGVNMELAARYINLSYTAHAPASSTDALLHYGIVAFPLTIGIRYRHVKDIVLGPL